MWKEGAHAFPARQGNAGLAVPARRRIAGAGGTGSLRARITRR